jgi:serine/threonine-protein kinase
MKPGERIGPYEILAPIGAGGMGEVYRARDTKLDREVAIKVLPEAVAQNPERLARFEREAKVLAALNHPTIAQIYGVEDRAIVMELVEGEEIKGPLPLETALDYARQIAGALEAAHEKGIVHRDLKPANIKVTPQGVVKVLDFGLAAVVQNSEPPETNTTQSPTLTLGATQMGVLLGTAAYMSPEQARGKPVDKRADIWAFGVVLYEMVTGRPLFRGDDISHTLAAVIMKEPDLEAVPAKIRRVLQRCLEKDPRKRLRDISGVELLLEETPETAPAAMVAPSRRWPGNLAWIAAGLLAVIAAAASWIAWRATRPVDRSLMRMNVDLGPDAVAGTATTVAISRDGTRIVYVVRNPGGGQQLATRLLGQATPTFLAGTDNPRDPFFSPDGQWIGFFVNGQLKKISVLGGAALALADAPNPRGASWGDDGNIIAVLNNNDGLTRVPAAGGRPQILTKPGENGENTHRWPQVLPGANAVLFTGGGGGGYEDANIEAVSLKTGETRILVRGGYFGRYLSTATSAGYLVYMHDGVLLGVPFDPVKLVAGGTPVPLLEDVAGTPGVGGGQFDVSRTGTLIYLGKSSTPSWPVAWLDSSGKTETLLAKPGNYVAPRLSPDGNWLALSVVGGKGQDLYVYDWRHDTMPRLTFKGQTNRDPVWAPDGKHIAFSSANGLRWVRADGAGEPQKLLESKSTGHLLTSISPDGRRLAYAEVGQGTNADIWTLPLDLTDPEHPKPGKPESFLRTPSVEIFPAFSPDGRWMAYASDESGRLEVYVRPFPGPGGKWQISTGGGTMPTWSRDGRELFYSTPDNRLMVTEYTAKGESFSYAKPRLWSDTRIYSSGRKYFDLAPDGKRFVVFPRADAGDEKKGSVHVTFLLNFFDEVRRRIPEGK